MISHEFYGSGILMGCNRSILLSVASTSLTGQCSARSYPALQTQHGLILPGFLVGLLAGWAQHGPSPPLCNLKEFPSVPSAG